MRYLTAELRITQLRHDFEYAWNLAAVGIDGEPTKQQVDASVALATGSVRKLLSWLDKHAAGSDGI